MSSQRHIFVIEDNEADAVMIEEALLTHTPSFDVTRFRDGLDALAELMKGNAKVPDAILLDLNLPQSDGLDILRQIRHTPKLTRVPVGIFTGSEVANDELRASHLGASRYVHKPKSYEAFVMGVRETVEQMLEQASDNRS